MGNTQPKKKKNTFESRISVELSNVIKYAEINAKRDYPSLYLTSHLFFYTSLVIDDCFAYKVIANICSSSSMDTMYEEFYEILEEETLSAVKPNTKIKYSDEFTELLKAADLVRETLQMETITSEHVLLAYLSDKTKDKFKTIFKDHGVTANMVKKVLKTLNFNESAEESTATNKNSFEGLLSGLFGGAMPNAVVTYSVGDGDATNMFNQIGGTNEPQLKEGEIEFCTELVSLVKKKSDTYIENDSIVESIVNTFAKRNLNNVILVGESGVGKTALVEHIANLIANNKLPELQSKKIYQFNIDEMAAGTQFRGMFAERVTSLLKALEKEKDAILFIDDVHDAIGSDNRREYDISGFLTKILNDGNIKVIATTTSNGYKKAYDGFKSMMKKFQKITIDPSSKEETKKILLGLQKNFEKYHKVKYPKDFFDTCIFLADRFLNDKALPLSAINLMDEVGAVRKVNIERQTQSIVKNITKLEKEKKNIAENDVEKYAKELDTLKDTLATKKAELQQKPITEDELYTVVSKISGIPVSKISSSEKSILKNIDNSIKKVVIGQDEAIDKICRTIKRNKLGLSPVNKPIGSFLCIGNTGCGKTLMAKTIAKEIFGDEKYLVRFDMSEYSDETSVNKLIGSSAGYVGYTEGGLLTEAVKNRKYAVVLVDEIEKANEKIFNLFLQILDEGFITDNMGEKVDFKNTVIMMTSNVGVKAASQTKGIGFTVNDETKRKEIIEKSLKTKFSPEFLNRLNDIIYFNDLNDDNLKDIVRLELNKFIGRLKDAGYDGEYSDKVVDIIFGKIKVQKEYGARPIARAIQENIENKVTDLLLENDYEKEHKFNFDTLV